MTDTLPGASVWEQQLYDHLHSHIDNEKGLLEAYRDAADRSGSAAFAYLAKLIIDDEIRHHQHFQDLAATIESDARLSSDDPAVPRIDWWHLDSQEISALTEQLIRQEEADLRELRRIRHEMRDVRDTTLWSLLIELMETDTAKHLSTLKFVRGHIRL